MEKAPSPRKLNIILHFTEPIPGGGCDHCPPGYACDPTTGGCVKGKFEIVNFFKKYFFVELEIFEITQFMLRIIFSKNLLIPETINFFRPKNFVGKTIIIDNF